MAAVTPPPVTSDDRAPRARPRASRRSAEARPRRRWVVARAPEAPRRAEEQRARADASREPVLRKPLEPAHDARVVDEVARLRPAGERRARRSRSAPSQRAARRSERRARSTVSSVAETTSNVASRRRPSGRCARAGRSTPTRSSSVIPAKPTKRKREPRTSSGTAGHAPREGGPREWRPAGWARTRAAWDRAASRRIATGTSRRRGSMRSTRSAALGTLEVANARSRRRASR